MANSINLTSWLEENKDSFTPPVCNKLMHGGQLKVMYIGGPNSRKDYHIDAGDELFYQLKGDMVLKVMENGALRDVTIKEGQLFLLPGKIPHSPQRQADTIGLVCERLRASTELDGLRYFVDGSSEVLWERWFYCEDLGKDLLPVLQEYQASEAFKSGKPAADSVGSVPPCFEIDSKKTLMRPFDLKEWLKDNEDELQLRGFKRMFPRGEYQTEVIVFSTGKHCISVNDTSDTFLWQMEGKSNISVDKEKLSMDSTGNNTVLVPPGKTILLDMVSSPAVLLSIRMHTP